MFNELASFLIKILMYVAATITRVVTFPIYAMFQLLIPDFSSFEDSFNSYVGYIARGLAFAREVFLNVTGFPRSLLTLLALLFTSKLSFHIASIPIKFLINTYRSIKGSGGSMVE